MNTFILTMVRYPAVFKKVQAEIDRVVGSERLPAHEDRESLPYLECVLKETIRCATVPRHVTEVVDGVCDH